MVHDHTATHKPISLVRTCGAIQALATRELQAGELVVPLFFKKQSSMVIAGDGASVHPRAVSAAASLGGGANRV